MINEQQAQLSMLMKGAPPRKPNNDPLIRAGMRALGRLGAMSHLRFGSLLTGF
jgi:hypothetical protein